MGEIRACRDGERAVILEIVNAAVYRRHGFELVSRAATVALLKTYWTVPDAQIESSVVLANPPFDNGEAVVRHGLAAEALTERQADTGT